MYVISGDNQQRPADFSRELRNAHFKKALVQFLIENWRKDELAPFIGSKVIYLNFDYCYEYKVENNKIIRNICQDLSCPEHEEADTKIVYHVCNIDYNSNVLIRCSDTDILVIMLGNMDHLKNDNIKIWIEVGVSNAQRFINVTELYKSLGKNICKALPGFHAFTGCDYNPAFFRKGKKHPLSILYNSDNYQKAFADLGDLENNDSTNVFETLEEFTCRIYSMNKMNTVNESRYAMFTKAYSCKDTNKVLKICAKNFDASTLPPCQSELKQQLLRASYIATSWRNAHLQHMTDLFPVENGWKEVDGKYEFTWFQGEQLPTFVSDILLESNEEENEGIFHELISF